MDMRAAETALRRAAKRERHALRMLDDAASDRAHKRHARRLQQARRAQGEARYLYEVFALQEAD